MKLGFLKYQNGYIVYRRTDIVGFVKKVNYDWSGYVVTSNRVVSGKTRREAAAKMIEQ